MCLLNGSPMFGGDVALATEGVNIHVAEWCLSLTDKSHFPAERMYRLQEMEQHHFWFKGRRKIINQFFTTYFTASDGLIVDVGCGTGAMVDYLVQRGYRILGIDMHLSGIEHTQQRLTSPNLIQGDALQLPFAPTSVDGVLLLDILEHTDDNLLLQEVHRCLKSEGKLLVAVPAIPWLWSYRDVAAGHLRRYTLQSLQQVLTANGFEIQAVRHYQFFAMPLLILTRLLGKRTASLRDKEDMPGPLVNKIMTWVSLLEVGLGRFIRLPWGSSIFVVCRRLN